MQDFSQELAQQGYTVPPKQDYTNELLQEGYGITPAVKSLPSSGKPQPFDMAKAAQALIRRSRQEIPSALQETLTEINAPRASKGAWLGLHKDAAEAFNQAQQEVLNRELAPIAITDAFRPHAVQEKAYADWKAGIKKAPIVAKPGTSKHEAGMAIDINTKGLSPAQLATYKDVLSRWGFVQNVKGEPWHFEFKGVSALRRIGRAIEGAVIRGGTSATTLPAAGMQRLMEALGKPEMAGYYERYIRDINKNEAFAFPAAMAQEPGFVGKQLEMFANPLIWATGGTAGKLAGSLAEKAVADAAANSLARNLAARALGGGVGAGTTGATTEVIGGRPEEAPTAFAQWGGPGALIGMLGARRPISGKPPAGLPKGPTEARPVTRLTTPIAAPPGKKLPDTKQIIAEAEADLTVNTKEQLEASLRKQGYVVSRTFRDKVLRPAWSSRYAKLSDEEIVQRVMRRWGATPEQVLADTEIAKNMGRTLKSVGRYLPPSRIRELLQPASEVTAPLATKPAKTVGVGKKALGAKATVTIPAGTKAGEGAKAVVGQTKAGDDLHIGDRVTYSIDGYGHKVSPALQGTITPPKYTGDGYSFLPDGATEPLVDRKPPLFSMKHVETAKAEAPTIESKTSPVQLMPKAGKTPVQKALKKGGALPSTVAEFGPATEKGISAKAESKRVIGRSKKPPALTGPGVPTKQVPVLKLVPALKTPTVATPLTTIKTPEEFAAAQKTFQKVVASTAKLSPTERAKIIDPLRQALQAYKKPKPVVIKEPALPATIDQHVRAELETAGKGSLQERLAVVYEHMVKDPRLPESWKAQAKREAIKLAQTNVEARGTLGATEAAARLKEISALAKAGKMSEARAKLALSTATHAYLPERVRTDPHLRKVVDELGIEELSASPEIKAKLQATLEMSHAARNSEVEYITRQVTGKKSAELAAQWLDSYKPRTDLPREDIVAALSQAAKSNPTVKAALVQSQTWKVRAKSQRGAAGESPVAEAARKLQGGEKPKKTLGRTTSIDWYARSPESVLTNLASKLKAGELPKDFAPTEHRQNVEALARRAPTAANKKKVVEAKQREQAYLDAPEIVKGKLKNTTLNILSAEGPINTDVTHALTAANISGEEWAVIGKALRANNPKLLNKLAPKAKDFILNTYVNLRNEIVRDPVMAARKVGDSTLGEIAKTTDLHFERVHLTREAFEGSVWRKAALRDMLKQGMSRKEAVAKLEKPFLLLDDMGSAKSRQKWMQDLVDSGQAKDFTEAAKILKRLREATTSKSGSLRYSSHEAPGYIGTVAQLKVLGPKYYKMMMDEWALDTLHRAARDRAIALEWGPNGEQWKSLGGRLNQISPSHFELISKVWDDIAGVGEFTDKGGALAALRKFNIVKMGMSAVANTGQVGNVGVAADVEAMAAGLNAATGASKVLNPKAWLAQTSAAWEEAARAGVISGKTWGLMAPIMRGISYVSRTSGWPEKFLRTVGWEHSEAFTRVVAYHAGKFQLNKMYKLLKVNPNNASANYMVEKVLGIKVPELLESGITVPLVRKAGQNMVRETMFLYQSYNMPVEWQRNEVVKTAMQFRSFVYQQTGLLKRALVDRNKYMFEAGNKAFKAHKWNEAARYYGEIPTSLLRLAAVGTLIGEGTNDLLAWIKGDVRPPVGLDRMIENIAAAGMLAMPEAFITSALSGEASSWSDKLTSEFTGPSLSTAGKAAQIVGGTIQGVQDEKRAKDIATSALRTAARLTGSLANLLAEKAGLGPTDARVRENMKNLWLKGERAKAIDLAVKHFGPNAESSLRSMILAQSPAYQKLSHKKRNLLLEQKDLITDALQAED